ncbi:hypothetical protein HBI98_22410 [Aeromonas veronii]|nr:hypothetical protein [Aeromonas veronii]
MVTVVEGYRGTGDCDGDGGVREHMRDLPIFRTQQFITHTHGDDNDCAIAEFARFAVGCRWTMDRTTIAMPVGLIAVMHCLLDPSSLTNPQQQNSN